MWPMRSIENHQLAGWRQWLSNRLNCFVWLFSTIRKGNRPDTLQQRINNCKRSTPILARDKIMTNLRQSRLLSSTWARTPMSWWLKTKAIRIVLSYRRYSHDIYQMDEYLFNIIHIIIKVRIIHRRTRTRKELNYRFQRNIYWLSGVRHKTHSH